MDCGIIGASGYGGTELLRLLCGHSNLEVAVACAGTQAGVRVAEHTPALAAAYPELRYAATDVAAVDGLDVVFLALPHGQSQDLVPDLLDRVGLVVDLAADFRLGDPATYAEWYGEPHRQPDLLDRFTYALPELNRAALPGARALAIPGCYPTAATLALVAFAEAGLLEGSTVVVDAVSGLSGAGRGPSERLHFAHASDDVVAYGLLHHRHTIEMERNLGAEILFTPHLAPMARGMAATCYVRLGAGQLESTEAAMALLTERFAAEPFVVVTDAPPSTKATLGSNCCLVSAQVDPRTGFLVAMSSLDNLVKGAAGAAIQAANVALGFEETTGLPIIGLYP